MSFLGLGASAGDDDDHDGDSSGTSVIHQDSEDDDDDAIRDDDEDIGFRRHHYETFEEDDADGSGKKKKNKIKRRRKSRHESKEDAIYGVFRESNDDDNYKINSRSTRGTPSSAPVFVRATQSTTESPPSPTPPPPPSSSTTTTSAPATHKSSSGSRTPMMTFVSTAKEDESPLKQQQEDEKGPTIGKPSNEEEEPPPIPSPSSSTPQPMDETNKESEEDAQRVADDYFHSLLRQAESKRKSQRQQEQQQQAISFASSSTMPMMEFMSSSSTSPPPPPPIKRDPTIAKWERHEKGIGSKLLFKMGWTGSGGLGSNRSKPRIKPRLGNAEESIPPATTTTNDSPMDSTPVVSTQPSTAPAAAPAFVRSGISQPIEVVVRPANLGLGFGSFKEQSQLKSNRKIEAAVRGMELPETTKRKKKKRGILDFHDDDGDDGDRSDDDDDDDPQQQQLPSTRSSNSSAIPTTQELMTQRAWKRRKMKNVTKAPKIIPYEELIKIQQEKSNSEGPVIIDMRGPSASSAGTMEGTTTRDAKVALGEELLHNVTFMLNTHENQLHSQAQMIKSINRKEASLQSEIRDLESQQKEIQDRRRKLEETLVVVQKVEDMVKQPLYENDHQQTEQVIEWIEELAASFSTDDRKELHFWKALAPALLSPFLQVRLEQWDPLGSIEASHKFLDSIFHIRIKEPSTDDREAVMEFQSSILQSLLIPRLRQVLESNSHWNPCTQTEVLLDVYEYMISLASTLTSEKRRMTKEDVTYSDDQVIFGGMRDDDEEEEINGTKSSTTSFVEILRKEVVLETVFPRLQAALSQWKPTLAKGGLSLEERLDLWILPWMPHLDHPIIFSVLLSECKRKLKSCLSYLQRKVGSGGGGNDLEFVQACNATMKPWAKIFDSKQLQRMISEYTTPYLARLLAKHRIERNSAAQDWTSIILTFDLHSVGLLSDVEFLSLFEGELLPRWVTKVGDMLVLQGMSPSEAATIYADWKSRIMMRTEARIHDQSHKLLRDDAVICAIFYTFLRMIELATHFKLNEVESLQPISNRNNYYVVAARRNKERQAQVQDDLLGMESRSKMELDARIRLRRRQQVDTPTFRDVVEEFAREQGIVFQPRMGGKAWKDGKQIFLFGNVPVYIEGDVIYANQSNTDWRPTSLDQLTELVTTTK